MEAVERRLDPLATNLVVADPSRTEKTICLAVSPSLKAYGISGRARLFEVVQRVKEVNRERLRAAIRSHAVSRSPEDRRYRFAGVSYNAPALAADPSLELSYITAPPRMRLYEEYSTKIYAIYLKYIAPEDIIVYSIDEVMIDATHYLKSAGMSARELAAAMVREVLYTTGITATAGIGTNLYLSKVAMDIVAKHVKPDRDGVRIAELDEQSYRERLWCHRPLTDFWRVGAGTARRLAGLGCFTMGDVARLSERDEGLLYDALGVNAELLIDHAWGWEPVDVATIKSYRPETNSLSSGQVLMEPYTAEKGRLIVREMTELLALDLVRKGLVTKLVTLTLGYDRESIECVFRAAKLKDSKFIVKSTGRAYKGAVTPDHYGRPHPKHAHGTGNIDRWTSSTRRIVDTMMELYDRIMDRDLLLRRVTVTAANLIREDEVPGDGPEQLDLFTDYEAINRQKAREAADDAREKRIQRTALYLQEKYGKNALLKGMNLEEGATTIARNGQIGGHRSD